MGNHKVLKSAGVNSRYSMYEFIAAVKSQTILWHRDHDDFHSRELRDRAWHEVGRQLCKNYDTANEEERNDIARTLLKRWKNTRDSYLRVFRMRQSGQDRSRPSYIYERELSFLLDGKDENKLLSLDESHNASSSAAGAAGVSTRDSRRQSARSGPNIKQEAAPQRVETTANRAAKRKSRADAPKPLAKHTRYADETTAYDISFSIHNAEDDDNNYDSERDAEDDVDTVLARDRHAGGSTTDNTANASVKTLDGITPATGDVYKYEPIASASQSTKSAAVATDPDQAFFESIKPHMQRMSDDQKLDFQIEILRLLRNFKAK